MRTLSLLIFLCFSQNFLGQFLISGPDFSMSSPLPCAQFQDIQNPNFYDPQGVSNYLPNTDETIVICPDLTLNSKIRVTFSSNVTFGFDVHQSDTLFVFDGPSTASPLLGAFNSSVFPLGVSFVSSLDNFSGCLTIRFKSDATNQGTGWAANVSCTTPFQPFEMHVNAFVNGGATNQLNPLDTGFVNVCPGDSIQFVANPIFPYSSLITNVGYNQNVTNVSYEWSVVGQGIIGTNQTVIFAPLTQAGYILNLKITDNFPYFQTLSWKVRVGMRPNFNGLGPIQDSLCFGSPITIVGGLTAFDTVGVNIPQGQFQLGGATAGTTYLPDIQGTSFVTTINIAGFPNTAAINNLSDLTSICINLEHSALHDIEIGLQCPNGTIISLVNSYQLPSGTFPGGFDGGVYYLGDANDLGTSPGIGSNYCFSPTFNTFGTMGAEFNAGNFVFQNSFGSGFNSMNSNGVYLPDGNLNALLGCPVNGPWSVIFIDNETGDDGYIFDWSISFDPNLQPGISTYQNYLVSETWNANPYITSGLNDTIISVVVPNAGNFPFTYTVTDNFGCVTDTSFILHVLPQPSIKGDTTICALTFNTIGTTSTAGGSWICSNPLVTFSNANSNNPTINFPNPGQYTLSFTDTKCGTTRTRIITIIPAATVSLNDENLCGIQNHLISPQYTGNWTSYLWNTGAATPTITTNSPGIFILTATNACQTIIDSTSIFDRTPSIMNDTTICNLNLQIDNMISFEGGSWSSGGNQNVQFSSVLATEPNVVFTTQGVYPLTFVDSFCLQTLTVTITIPTISYLFTPDTSTCIGNVINYEPVAGADISSFIWNTGATSNVIQISQPGQYILNANSACFSYVDTLNVSFYQCTIEVPNIFTPNGDAANGLFTIKTEGIADFKCQLFNRWGNLVYEYTDQSQAWDGNIDGNPASEGTYFYIINAKTNAGEVISQSGYFQIAR